MRSWAEPTGFSPEQAQYGGHELPNAIPTDRFASSRTFSGDSDSPQLTPASSPIIAQWPSPVPHFVPGLGVHSILTPDEVNLAFARSDLRASFSAPPALRPLPMALSVPKCEGTCSKELQASVLRYFKWGLDNKQIDVLVQAFCDGQGTKSAENYEKDAKRLAGRHCKPTEMCECSGSGKPICQWFFQSPKYADDIASGFLPGGSGKHDTSGARHSGLGAAKPLRTEDDGTPEEERVYIEIVIGNDYRGNCVPRAPK